MLSENRSRGRLFACLGWLAACAAPLHASAAREESTREVRKDVRIAPAQPLRVEHSHGNVTLRAHARDELLVVARIRVSAARLDEATRFANEIRVEVQESPAGVLLRTVYPERPGGGWLDSSELSFSVDYDLAMPERSPLFLRNRFGAVSVSGLKARAEITNAHGLLRFQDTAGSHRLENSFGGVEVARNAGDVVVTSANHSVNVSDVTGSVEVRNRFGAVKVKGVKQAATIVNSNGSVELSGAGAASSVRNSFGPVTAATIAGDLTVRNGNGAVDARGVAGAAELSTSYGSIAFDDVGPLTVTATNTRVSGGRVRGAARVTTSFGAVDVSDVTGSATVRNDNAGVTLRNVQGPIDVHGRFGPVEATGVRKGGRIEWSNGNVAVLDSGGPLFVRTSFGQARAERIAGALEVENSNGGVVARGVEQAAAVRASFGAVSLSDVGGAVAVRNQNGAVEVSLPGPRKGAADACRVVLETSFAPIRLSLPEDGGFDVTASTSFGKVRSELPLGVSGALAGEALSGRIGAGGCEVRLTNSNGGIELLRQGGSGGVRR
jgi:hypothetical protein